MRALDDPLDDSEKQEGRVRLRPHVPGYFWVRNFFFADAASVHTYPANPEHESATFWIRFPEKKIFEYAMNLESCGR